MPRWSDVFGGVGLADVLVALLLASVLLFPAAAGNKAWPPALALLAVYASVQIVRRRRLPPTPLAIIGYTAVCVLAVIHGGIDARIEVWRYFAGPLTALAVATVVVTARQRLRVLIVFVALVLLQIPVAVGQMVDKLVTYGRHPDLGDFVYGTLGRDHAGILTLVTVAAAAIVLAGWLCDALSTWTVVVLEAGLLSLAVFSATRAAPAFIVFTCVAMLAAIALHGREPALRRLIAAALASVVAGLVVLGLIVTIYPNAFRGAFSSQEHTILGQSSTPPGGSGRSSPDLAHTITPLLPGRVAQMRLAARLSVHSGAAVAVFGRGLGRSEVRVLYTEASQIPPPRRTATTWIGKALTETGWLGLIAFAGLICWLVVLGWRLWGRPVAPLADRVMGAALPGIAALTAAGAAYATILSVRGYSTVFWVLVGVAIAAAYRPDEASRLPQEADG
ncbi:MAG TPA: hypothetical protein VN449_08880 [Gaiellaceae bacterium]|nr:hypothetical protein [Gaiellaceae bacterium]